MTTPRDPEALLTAYLAGGMEVLPDRVVESVLGEIHGTRQRTVFGPRRSPISRTALAAAAVVATLTLGAVLFVVSGGPSPEPSEEPRPSRPAVVAPSSVPDATAPTAPTALAFPRTTGVWVATGSMVTPRFGHTAVRLLDGRVLVVGGASSDAGDTSAELYDPATGTWSATGSMVRTGVGSKFAATLLRDGRVLVGDDQGAEVYDPDDGTWTVTKTMALIDEDGSSHWGKATLLRDGRVLVVHDEGSAELYDPDSGLWTATGELTPPVDIPTPVTLPDGRVLVAGGEDASRDGDRAALYDPATGAWTATGTMGTPRLEHLVVPLLDGRVLVVGGANDDQDDTSAELYDPATGTWSATGSMLRRHEGFPATLLRDGRVLVGDANGAELYDPDSGTWTDAGIFTPIYASATLLLDGTVLVAGDSAALYVPAGVSPPPRVELDGGIWIATGSMGSPRDGHTAVRLLDGRVLVVGGADENDTSAELYDPATGTWSATGSMLKPHSGGFDATLLRDGRVIVGNVDDPEADDPIDGAEVYDPASGTWTATGKMVRGGGKATLLVDGSVLVTGNDGAQRYDPADGTWTATGEMVDPRHSHVAILLSDGNVLVAGGHAPGDDPTAKAELYDPNTGAWTAIADMHAPREDIEAFLQRDGRVLVIGGSNRNNKLSVELYDPATGTWTESGDMPKFASATLLADGTVLLVHDSFAERYDPGTGTLTTTAAMLRRHGTPLTLLLDGTVLVAGGSDCLDGVCVTTGSAELYVPAGVSPPSLPAFPSPAPPVIPSPTPLPTPFPPRTGPVPQNGREWTVTVDNKSPNPVTLFLAEDGEDGIGQLCGSVTPNVVPAGVTQKVTFLLPPKSVKSCWIWLNPVPGQGGSLFQTSDAPLAGKIFFQEGGQGGWLSP